MVPRGLTGAGAEGQASGRPGVVDGQADQETIAENQEGQNEPTVVPRPALSTP